MGVLCRRGCGFLGGGSTNKKVSKLKSLLHLTVCRLTILRKQRKARCSHARGDLLQLVQLGHRDRALLRAELVIKEENMLDVFAMLESYCHLLTESLSVLLRGEKVCPDELREAVSSLIYASSRLADLPELYHVRNVFSYMFGKDFTNSAVEVRNCCGVNPKIVQKLSTRQPSLETRIRITKEIAASNGITFDLGCDDSITCPDIAQTTDAQPAIQVNRIDSSARGAHKFKDAVSAAQAAYESAEDAAAAARVAVELSQSGRRKVDPNILEEVDEKRNGSNFSESDEDDAIELYFGNARLYPDEPEEEDTFELATLNVSDKPNLENCPSPLYHKIISGRRNRGLSSGSEDMGLFRLSYSSDTTSCRSKSGRDEAENVSPMAARRAFSVRTRRGLPR